MWRPSITILRKAVLPSMKDNSSLSKLFYSNKSRIPRSTVKVTLVSASIGVVIGAGYGGYTHYKINMKKNRGTIENENYLLLKEPPVYQPQYKVR